MDKPVGHKRTKEAGSGIKKEKKDKMSRERESERKQVTEDEKEENGKVNSYIYTYTSIYIK